MAQQTAMQKLLTNLESIGITIPLGVKMVYLKIEKEQIIKAHNNAVVSPYTDLYAWETNGKSQITKGEQYYNETYSK